MNYIIGITTKGRKFMYEMSGDEYLIYECGCGNKGEAFIPFLLEEEGFDVCLRCEMPFRYFIEFEHPEEDDIPDMLRARRHDGYLRGYDLPREGRFAIKTMEDY